MKTNLIIFFLFICCVVSAQRSMLDLDRISGFDLSPDEQTIVVAGPVWDTTTEGILYIVDVESDKIKRLVLGEAFIFSSEFSPDGDSIIFESNLGQISSCDLQGRNIQKYNPLSRGLFVHDICYSSDGKSVYFSADSILANPKVSRIYQLSFQDGKTNIIPDIKASSISGLNACGDDLLFSIAPQKGVKEAKMIRLKPKEGNITEEIIPEGNPKCFINPKYHKATNQLIFSNNAGFYKMNIDTKEYKHFYNIEKGRLLMFYDIAQNQECLYFYEVGTRYITVINFEGKELCRIPLTFV